MTSSGETANSGALHLAIDLGAGGGRAILGRLTDDGLVLDEVHRFLYPPETSAGHLRWSFGRILDGIKAGLGKRSIGRQSPDNHKEVRESASL